MSDHTPTESPRLLKSPFNNEVWPVPPDVNPTMYDALLKAGFTEVKTKEAKRGRG